MYNKMDDIIKMVKNGTISGREAYNFFSRDFPNTKVKKDTSGLSDEDAYRFYAGKILANRGPVSELGYDEGKLVLSPSRERRSNISGMTKENRQMYVDLNDPSAVAHESIHAGILSLPEDSDLKHKLMINPHLNEMITRAIMLRRYGGIEEKELGREDPQVRKAQKMLQNDPEFVKMIQQLEREAGKETARRLINRQGAVL